MVVQAKVKDGVIVPDGNVPLIEGATVYVSIPVPAGQIPKTLLERLSPIVGAVKDMPPDASENIDHYLYGQPKQ